MSHHTRRQFLKVSGGVLGGIAAGTTVTAAESRDRFIVDLRSATERDLADVDVIHRLEQIDIAIVRGSESDVAGTRSSPDVTFEFEGPAVDAGEAKPSNTPSLYDIQWDKQAQDVPDVHSTTSGAGSRVSVIDSGVLADHPDLDVNTELSANLTDDGGDFTPVGGDDHGTHVAGTVAATNASGEGVIGTAPDTDLVAIRVFSAEGGAAFGDIIAAMVYSGDIGCDAANLSLGAYPIPLDGEGVQVLVDSIERATAYANEQGTLIVASAGNDGANLNDDPPAEEILPPEQLPDDPDEIPERPFISLPNEADNTMSISATGPVGYRWDDKGNGKYRRNHRAALNHLEEPTTDPAFYTNYGSEAVDVSAPGGNVGSDVLATPPADRPENWLYDLVVSTTFTVEGGVQDPGYGWKAGTSMASPQVAGVAALIASLDPDASPGEVRDRIESTAADIGESEFRGEGHLDTAAAVGGSDGKSNGNGNANKKGGRGNGR
ncbi:S8 family peptidase [Halococcus agarilyticus]|uniref:S8 family peptidase n=1 Tax=Halococcus agarilyticus TaxID=1232219 RepID=UPI00067765CC|nr:S8 family serine peptidase [Halococcus agarilyticus]